MRGHTASGLLLCAIIGSMSVPRAIRGDDIIRYPKVGDPAPALNLEKLLLAPEGARANWEALRGKVVVLDFWATWCGPCVAMLPHLNKLHAQFAGEPIVFISVTDEDESVVKSFLENNPMKSWVGLDTDESVFKSYGVSGRPKAALVDRQGKLVGWTSPSAFVDHPEILRDLLAGKTPTGLSSSPVSRGVDVLADGELFTQDLAGSDEEAPLFLMLIRPAKKVNHISMGDSGRGRYYGMTIRSAIAQFYDIPESYILSDIPLPKDRKYDIVYRWPEGNHRLGRSLGRQAIEATFGLTIRREKRVVDAYVLSVPEGMTPVLEPAMSHVVPDPTTLHVAPNADILARMNAGETFFMALGHSRTLAENLSGAIGAPVVDEAKIAGYYLFYFPYDVKKPDSKVVIERMAEKYGLVLTPAKREVEVLIVEQAGHQK